MYIVFEGIVGTGKTTQSKLLAAWLKEQLPHRQVLWTREPGGTEISDVVRSVVQGTSFNETMHPLCEAYLYAASRAQSLRSVVKPCLDSGGIVVADRSFITSLVYQGHACGIGINTAWGINSFAVGDVVPDLVIYLDLPVNVALARAKDQAGDKWEKLGIDFFTNVETGYKIGAKLPQLAGVRWINVSAEGTPEQVFERVVFAIKPFLGSTDQ